MAKTILGEIPVLPDIDTQIEYVKHIRKDVIPSIKPLQSELTMIYAIEQSLIGLKREFQSQSKIALKQEHSTFSQPPHASPGDLCTQILNSFGIKLTSVRIDILSVILSKEGQEFTITEIYRKLRRKGISKSAVIATMDLFRTRGLIIKTKPISRSAERRPGRPEAKFKTLKDSYRSILSAGQAK